MNPLKLKQFHLSYKETGILPATDCFFGDNSPEVLEAMAYEAMKVLCIRRLAKAGRHKK